ncbi:MAG: TonB-dependent receptor [Bacteroidia bacterium]|nr:TonB-dependent receptor [Bacteroidia bacterium]
MSLSLSAQVITGHVYELDKKKKVPLEGAMIRELGFPNGSLTDSSGKFSINVNLIPAELEVSFVSFDKDTIHVEDSKTTYEVVLRPAAGSLGKTEINRRRKTYGVRSIDPKTTINLNEREFQKAACCNLSESFENAPAIDVSFTDAVTGTKQIKMLGLDGVYTSITREFMPSVRGLNSFYGLSFIPAAWVNGIQITKGAGSVVNGFESMTGQINIEMKKPFGEEDFMLDQFVSESGRSETDLMIRKDINLHLATSLFGRFSTRPLEMDRNNDGFMDMPTGNQFQVMNRWQFYTDKGYEGQLNASYNNDSRKAGQIGDSPNYGVNIENEQFDVWGKLGKANKKKPYQSFGSQYAFNTISSQTVYGNDSNQKVLKTKGRTAYANVMHQSIIGNTNHGYKAGVSLLSDWVEESYDTFQFDRIEHTLGSFVEYTWKPDTTWIVVVGARGDYSSIFGFFPTARIHAKKVLNKGNTTVRLSAGNGRRTANYFAQNQNILIASREMIVNTRNGETPGLLQERSNNAGISVHHKFKLTYMPSELQVDFFRTAFLDELLVNRETSGQTILQPLENSTIANSAQVQLDVQPMRRTEIRLAYRMFDVSSVYNGERMQKPLIAQHRGFVNLTQRNRKKWQLSTTVQLYGKQRLPGFEKVGSEMKTEYSPVFMLLNAQLSKKTKKSIEYYLGVENLFNRRQNNPINGAENPYGADFDAAMVWGPIFGRMIYGGFRYRITK